MTFETCLDLGDLGERDCIIEANTFVEKSLCGFDRITVTIVSLEIWNDRLGRVVDMTEWIDSPRIRQRIETYLENEYEQDILEQHGLPISIENEFGMDVS